MSTYLGNQLLSGVATNTISNAHSLFDFKWSDHILNEMSWLRADTFSWHNGNLYKAAYNHLVNDISGALVSNFNLHIVQDTNNKWLLRLESGSEIVGPSGNTKTLSSSPGIYGSDSNVGQEFLCFASLGSGTEWVESCLVSEYYVQPTQPTNPAQYAFWYDTANNVIKTTFDAGTQWYGDYSYPLGKYVNRGSNGFNGPEDLLENYNGIQGTTSETIGSYTINYYLAPDGHKIVSQNQESIAQNIYNESGVAWYYILDTTNQRFKLPRINPAREELIQTIRAKGNGMTLGLTNGTDNAGAYNLTNYALAMATGNIGTGVGTATSGTLIRDGNTVGVVTDSTKSGIISSMTDSTSVYKGRKYLYFYVGQFSQSAAEQTAGLNTELFNGKIDLDGSNAGFVHIIETYHNGSEFCRIYSDGWCEQGGYMARAAATTNVTYHKEFIDTNYNLQMSVRHTAAGTDGRPPLINTPTTTGFTASINTSYEGFYWKACGYIVLS